MSKTSMNVALRWKLRIFLRLPVFNRHLIFQSSCFDNCQACFLPQVIKPIARSYIYHLTKQ